MPHCAALFYYGILVYNDHMRFTFPKTNHVILLIIIAMFLLTTAFGFLAPIFAIFITQQIAGATVATVGFAITIYWTIKSILQLFVARYIDKNHGEIDDFYFFLAGVALNAIFISLYFWAREIWHVYALHSAIGVGDALLIPPFYAIFTRHIDKGQEGFDWALYSSFSIGAGSAIGGALGGIFATLAGFRVVFLIVGLLSFVSAVILLFLRPYIRPKVPLEVSRIPIDGKRI